MSVSKEEFKATIREVVNEALANHDRLQQQKPTEHVEVGDTASDIITHLKGCPECYSKVGEGAYKLKLDAECRECGKSVSQYSETCPYCGNKGARHKEGT